MSQPAGHERVFVQCLPGLESVLEAEAKSLGRVRRVAGGVEVDGPAGLHVEAVLVLRVAERVLLRLVEAPVRTWADVVVALGSASLDLVAEPGAAVELETSVRVSAAPPAHATHRALTQLWRRPVTTRRTEDRESGSPRLLLRVAEGKASLSADVGGELLHRRGWRQETSRAPMRETLAAGVLALAGYAADRPLRDPICGSGTLVIEAALAARSVAPGVGRSFAAEHWPVAGRMDWAGRRDRLRAGVRAKAPAEVVGGDLNAGALGTARRNARRAGVLGDLRLERVDVAVAVPTVPGPGLVVGNLPYGIRVGARDGLERFDVALARTLRGPFADWRRALLVDDEARLERAGGAAPDRVHRLVNGGVPVVLGVWDATR